LFCAAVAVLVFWAARSEIYLPLKITVGYESHAPKGLTAYVDTGHGFNESETLLFTHSRFVESQRSTGVWFGPPIRNLRLDPGYRPFTISLTSLCLDSLVRSTCWSAPDLARKLVPANDIGNVDLDGGSYRITKEGSDPYLVFNGGFIDEYREHALVRKRIALPLAVLLPALLIWAWFVVGPRLVDAGRRIGRASIHLTWWQGLGVFVLLALISTGNWLQLDDADVPVWAVLLGIMLTAAFFSGRGIEPRPLSKLFTGISGDGFIAATVSVLLATVPVFLLLALTWEQEFPYVGDQHFHLEIDRATYHFVRDHFPELSVIVLSLLFCMLVGWVRIWLVGATVFFVVWSFTEAVPQFFVRYPGTGRFVAAPFFHVAENYLWDSLLNVARLANASGILVWLLVLRPLIVKRWPDWSIAPVAAALFFQFDVAYYFTSAYLEPWSLIFLLLAVEHQIRYGSRANHSAAAMLLVGIAAIIKEAAIFMLPVVWLAGRPWRHGIRHVLRTCVTAIAAALPFLVYFLIRAGAGERPFRMVGPDQFITFEKLVETYYQFDFHFGPGGELLCVLLLLLLVVNVFSRARGISNSRTASALMLLAGTAFYLAYNYLEATSLGYAGYTRYYLFPYALLCLGLLFLQWPWKLNCSPAIAFAAAAAVILLNAGTLVPYYSKSRLNDAQRNFTEHYDAPVFMPIRGLVNAAGNAGDLEEGTRITINNPLGWGMPSIGLNYPDLRRRYQLRVEENVPCVCSEEKSVILQPFVFMGGLNTHLRLPQTRRALQQFPKKHFYRIWTDQDNNKPVCLTSMGATCGSVFEVWEQSELIGILGVL
jgi:hypothetical protein